jgi:uncharacterized membrane protein affecting hemolysin expression
MEPLVIIVISLCVLIITLFVIGIITQYKAQEREAELVFEITETPAEFGAVDVTEMLVTKRKSKRKRK